MPSGHCGGASGPVHPVVWMIMCLYSLTVLATVPPLTTPLMVPVSTKLHSHNREVPLVAVMTDEEASQEYLVSRSHCLFFNNLGGCGHRDWNLAARWSSSNAMVVTAASTPRSGCVIQRFAGGATMTWSGHCAR